MELNWNIKRIQIIVFLILGSYSYVIGQDFNVHEDILSLESEKLELGNLDSNPLMDAIYYNLHSVGIALNIGENLSGLSNVEIYQSENEIRQIEIIDFDGDGYDDVIVLEEDYGALELLMNDGNGSFVTTILIDSCQIRTFKAIDIDQDDDIDIFGTSQVNDFADQNLIFYRQEANMIFDSLVLDTRNSNFASDQICFKDIDLDGDLDLLYIRSTSGWDPPSPPYFTEYLLFLQESDGSLSKSSIKLSNLKIADVQLADMNSDELLDIIVTTAENQSGYDNLFVAFQEDNLTFAFKDISPNQQIFNRDGVAFELLDINQDGNLDVVYELKGFRASMNQGNKNFEDRLLIPNDPDNDFFTREFQVADFNNDGLEDILATFNSTGRANAPKEWFWYKMTDRSTLTFEQQDFSYKESEDDYNLWHISDLNGDGYQDIIADRGNSFIFENLIMSTSTDDHLFESDDRVSIYPNPANEIINVDFGEVQIEKVLIYNSEGQLMRSILDMSPKLSIDVKDLPIGTYYLSMRGSKKGRVIERAFIKVGNN